MKFFEDTFEILNKPFNIFLLLLSEGFKEYNNNKYSVNSDKFEPNDIQTRFLKIVEDLKNIVLNQNIYTLKQLKTILNKKVNEYFKLIDLRIILKNFLLKLYKIRDLNFKNDENEFNKNPLKFYDDIYKDINNDEVLKLSNKIIKPIYNIIKDIIIKDEENKKDKELKKEDEAEKIKSIELDKDIYNDTDLNKLKEDIFKNNIVYSQEDLLKLQKLEKLFKEYETMRDAYYQQTIYINKKFYKDKLDKIKQEISDYISKLKDVDEINTIYLKLLNSKSIINNLYDNINEKRKNKNFNSWIKDYTYYVNLYLKLPLFYREKINNQGINIDPSLIDYSNFVTNIKTKELYNRIIFYLSYFVYNRTDKDSLNKGGDVTRKLKTFGIDLNYEQMKKLSDDEIKKRLFGDYNVDMSYIDNLIAEIKLKYDKLGTEVVENYDKLISRLEKIEKEEEEARLKKEKEEEEEEEEERLKKEKEEEEARLKKEKEEEERLKKEKEEKEKKIKELESKKQDLESKKQDLESKKQTKKNKQELTKLEQQLTELEQQLLTLNPPPPPPQPPKSLLEDDPDDTDDTEDTDDIQKVQQAGLFKKKFNIDKKNININRIILKKQREKELKTIRILKRQNKINQIISNFMKQQNEGENKEEFSQSENVGPNPRNKEGGALFDKNLLNKYINRIS